ncbi:MATE family efflux transporter [Lachnoclostridium sp. Marseille-P6806]|uniref:MATE family efflux transporter n=1 Tax=Lachnoclostridium sp. Marseille-P6806 TaxID=2364793 RepID=UPI0013EF150C|nr:MATE family efflux transporter [Lachnoclostridium sp. Marseille-P6806]
MANALTGKGRYDFTQGKIVKPMLIFSLPISIGDIFSALYNVVDSIVVGQYVGSAALAAVSASFAITMVCVAVYAGFGIGCGVVIGQLFGAREKEKLDRAIGTAYAGALVIGLTMTVVGLIISKPLLVAINTPEEIINDANIYLMIYFLGCTTQLCYYMTSGMMRSLGDSKIPMIILTICAVLNIVLDILFVVAFHWGCAGVALATVLSQALSAVIIVRLLFTPRFGFTFRLRKMRIDREIIGMIFKIGIPSAIQSLVSSFGLLIIQSYSNSFGTNLVASNGIVQKLDSFSQLPIMALGQTITTFTAQNLGAGQKERVIKGNRIFLFILFAIGAAVGVILFFAVVPLYRLFISPSDPGFQEIIEIGMNSIHVMAFFYCVVAIQLGTGSILRGAGAAMPVMVIAIVSIIVRVPITYFMAAVPHNYVNLYWATSIFNVIFALGMVAYYKFGNWSRYVVVNRGIDFREEV